MNHPYNEECCCVECVYIRQQEKKQADKEEKKKQNTTILQQEGQLEIERRWLLDDADIPLNLDQLAKDFIAQGYITPGNQLDLLPPNVTFRLRRKGDAYFFTRKFGTGVLVRNETELQLTAEQFHLMWSMVGQQYIEKSRYYLKTNILVEMDIFQGKLNGLVIAEIEFDSKEKAEAFRAPDWFGREITEDVRYTNYSLALNGRPDEA